MAVSITYTPEKVSLVGKGMKCLFKLNSNLDTDVGRNHRIHVQLSVQSIIDTGDHNEVYTFDDDGNVEIDVADYLRPYLRTVFRVAEDPDEMIIYRPEMIAYFQIEAYDSYIDDNDVVQNSSTVNPADNAFYGILGGIDPRIEALYNAVGTSWYNEHLVNKEYLTHLPDQVDVHPNQPVKLYWLNESALSDEIVLEIEYTDGSNEDLEFTHSLGNYSVYEICVSPAIIQAKAIPGKWVKKYGVYFSSLKSRHITFNVDRNYYRRNDFFLFRNSLGGIDSIWAHGSRKDTSKYSREEYTRILDYGHKLDFGNVTGSRAQRNCENKSFLYYRVGDDQSWYDELYLTEKMFHIEDALAFPVRCQVEEAELLDDETNGLYELILNWALAYTSRYHTKRQQGQFSPDDLLDDDISFKDL